MFCCSFPNSYLTYFVVYVIASIWENIVLDKFLRLSCPSLRGQNSAEGTSPNTIDAHNHAISFLLYNLISTFILAI